ncbi:MAG: hypothetical protein ACUVSY_12800 [Roseiflexus sp.]
MSLEVTKCPICGRKLALQAYVMPGTRLVCTDCESNLYVETRRPLRLRLVSEEATYNADDRPESYG